MRDTIVMFDLENTIIDSWHSRTTLVSKCDNINNILKSFQIDHDFKTAGIFSFAVDNDNEKVDAVNSFAGLIKDKFDLDLNSDFFPNMNDILKLVDDFFHIKSANFQKWEVINLFGKEITFDAFCSMHPGVDFILFDDTVSNKTIVKHDTNQTINFIRV